MDRRHNFLEVFTIQRPPTWWSSEQVRTKETPALRSEVLPDRRGGIQGKTVYPKTQRPGVTQPMGDLSRATGECIGTEEAGAEP